MHWDMSYLCVSFASQDNTLNHCESLSSQSQKWRINYIKQYHELTNCSKFLEFLQFFRPHCHVSDNQLKPGRPQEEMSSALLYSKLFGLFQLIPLLLAIATWNHCKTKLTYQNGVWPIQSRMSEIVISWLSISSNYIQSDIFLNGRKYLQTQFIILALYISFNERYSIYRDNHFELPTTSHMFSESSHILWPAWRNGKEIQKNRFSLKNLFQKKERILVECTTLWISQLCLAHFLGFMHSFVLGERIFSNVFISSNIWNLKLKRRVQVFNWYK